MNHLWHGNDDPPPDGAVIEYIIKWNEYFSDTNEGMYKDGKIWIYVGERWLETEWWSVVSQWRLAST